MASGAGRIILSGIGMGMVVPQPCTAVKQPRGVRRWSSNKCHRDLSVAAAVKQWRGVPQWPKEPFSPNTPHSVLDIGYTVDVPDLLSTPERNFLVKNNGQKIKVDDLRGKTIVLFIVPLDESFSRPEDTWDMIDAYHELLRVGSDVEFVFVPVQLGSTGLMPPEALFDKLFSTVPFPAIPFSDVQGRESPVVRTFSIGRLRDGSDPREDICRMPYWVVIDPTNKVVATRFFFPSLFKLFGGAELHPLSQHRIDSVEDYYFSQSKAQLISKWDQLLASDTRDFLLSSNGDKVPISSLKGKLVGLYFCENIPHPPRLQAIKKVYEEAKSRGYDFEIVQITFHYHPFNAKHRGTDPSAQQCCEDVSWLTLPFKDPSCRKVQRIFRCVEDGDGYWVGDRLVLIYPCQDKYDNDECWIGVPFELLGAEILERWGIEGYPFTRPSLYKAEYELLKREVTLQSLFSPGECLVRSSGDGFDLVDHVSQLSGKRVLVLFAPHSERHLARIANFISMLKSEYEAQLKDNVEEESKFEVVYVSTGYDQSSFDEVTKDMPWLVRPYSRESRRDLLDEIFKSDVSYPCAAAFNEQGELVAKESDIGERKEAHKLRFPFIDQDLEKQICREVEQLCHMPDSDAPIWSGDW